MHLFMEKDLYCSPFRASNISIVNFQLMLSTKRNDFQKRVATEYEICCSYSY